MIESTTHALLNDRVYNMHCSMIESTTHALLNDRVYNPCTTQWSSLQPMHYSMIESITWTHALLNDRVYNHAQLNDRVYNLSQ